MREKEIKKIVMQPAIPIAEIIQLMNSIEAEIDPMESHDPEGELRDYEEAWMTLKRKVAQIQNPNLIK